MFSDLLPLCASWADEFRCFYASSTAACHLPALTYLASIICLLFLLTIRAFHLLLLLLLRMCLEQPPWMRLIQAVNANFLFCLFYSFTARKINFCSSSAFSFCFSRVFYRLYYFLCFIHQIILLHLNYFLLSS